LELRPGLSATGSAARRRTSDVIALGRFLGWLALVPAIAYLVAIGGGFPGIYDVSLRITSLGLIVVGLVAWTAVAVRRPAWRPRTAIWPAFVAALGVFAISLALSAHPRLGADYLAYAVLLTALYLLLQRLMADSFFRTRVTSIATVLLIIVGGWDLLAVGRDWLTWWTSVGRITTPPLRPAFEGLTFGNPSAVMTIILLLATTSIADVSLGRARDRVFAAGVILLTLVVTVISGSRAGWLAASLAVGVTGLVWVARTGVRGSVARLAESRRVRIATATGLVAFAVAAVALAPAILARVTAGGEELRATFYASALRMFASSPLVGTGPGSWVVLQRAFTNQGEIDYVIPHAHSIYAQTLAEFGLAGVAAGVVVAAALTWLIRGALRDPDPGRVRFGWAALFATIYFAAHQALDFYANMPAALFAFAIPIAWLDATAPRPMFAGAVAGSIERFHGAGHPAVARVLSAIGLAGVVVSVAWLSISEGAAAQFDRGVTAANAGTWDQALPAFAETVRRDPDIPAYRLAFGVAAANGGDYVAAAAALERAATTDDLPVAWLDLAAVREASGDGAGAAAALDRALRLGRQQAQINLGAGIVRLRLGARDAAVDDLALALRQAPSLAGDPWWSTPEVTSVRSPALDRAIADADPATGFDLALSAGQLERARSLASQMEPTQRESALLVIAAWEGDGTARADLVVRARSRPLEIGVVIWCARIAARAGDQAAAAEFRTWLDTVSPGSALAGLEVRVSPDPSPLVAGSTALFSGHYLYRRPTPEQLIVALLPQLVDQ
jgi:O-antigen ligase/Tfp pilus assembly protein PilF